jgi:hypothetical protein
VKGKQTIESVDQVLRSSPAYRFADQNRQSALLLRALDSTRQSGFPGFLESDHHSLHKAFANSKGSDGRVILQSKMDDSPL